MITRRDFVQDGLLAAGALATALAANAAGAQTMTKAKFVDKLTDESGKYFAAPLPFAFDALEPVIDARTVELHYTFHHKPAVVAANRAEEALAKARETGDFSAVKYLAKELAFQLSSHILHTIYWSNMSGKGGEPKGDLAKMIARDFTSFDKFKAHIVAATSSVEASGWGMLGYHPASKRLMILQCENHQKLTAWGITPILMLDVFEHAYYLKYQNRRGEYVGNLFNLISWDNVAMRLDAAMS